MLKLILFLSAVLLSFSAGAQNLKNTFERQINSSNESLQTYSKTIFDNIHKLSETKFYKKGDPKLPLLTKELEYATRIVYDNPKVIDYFTKKNNKDSIIIIINKENYNDCELKVQKALYSSKTKALSYLESTIEISSWLYELKINIKVNFDSEGRYLAHQLNLKIIESYWGDGMHTIINGAAAY